jgi:hypothetical protein
MRTHLAAPSAQRMRAWRPEIVVGRTPISGAVIPRPSRLIEPDNLHASLSFEEHIVQIANSGMNSASVPRMRIEKIVLEKSVKALLDKADDCFDLAKTQHNLAEKQHESAALQQENADKQQAIAAQQHSDADKLDTKADKLDALGHELEANAVEIKGETQLVQREP